MQDSLKTGITGGCGELPGVCAGNRTQLRSFERAASAL